MSQSTAKVERNSATIPQRARLIWRNAISDETITAASTKRSSLPILMCGRKCCKSLLKISVPPVEPPERNVSPIPKPYRSEPNMDASTMSSVIGGSIENISTKSEMFAAPISVLKTNSLPIILSETERKSILITAKESPGGIFARWYSIVEIPDTPPLTILFGR